MLQTKAIESGTFSVLKDLMTLPEMNQFSLVGVTALALRFGHRSSIDIDLFFHEKFEQPLIIKALEKNFGERFEYK